MIDWEEIINAQTDDPLREAKLWLFQENVRIAKEKENLVHMQDKFLRERGEFREELESMNLKTITERRRLKEESAFFEKKMAILQNGFRMLEEDRRNLERDRSQLEQQRALLETNAFGDPGSIARALFRSANGSLTLRKRYRDLVKIFHPDNMCGDDDLIQCINQEYLRKQNELA
jgi:hypothetical protein